MQTPFLSCFTPFRHACASGGYFRGSIFLFALDESEAKLHTLQKQLNTQVSLDSTIFLGKFTAHVEHTHTCAWNPMRPSLDG